MYILCKYHFFLLQIEFFIVLLKCCPDGNLNFGKQLYLRLLITKRELMKIGKNYTMLHIEQEMCI